jgi:hypothetical protein
MTHELKNNDELYTYLRWLSEQFNAKGRIADAKEIAFVSQFASSWPTTEFLGESRRLLASLRPRCGDVLTDEQKKDLTSILEQIQRAFE